MYALTSHFISFSEPVVWQDKDRIGTTMLKGGNVFYRFTKDSGTNGTNCVNIIEENSEDLQASLNGWSVVTGCSGAKTESKQVLEKPYISV